MLVGAHTKTVMNLRIYLVTEEVNIHNNWSMCDHDFNRIVRKMSVEPGLSTPTGEED